MPEEKHIVGIDMPPGRATTAAELAESEKIATIHLKFSAHPGQQRYSSLDGSST